MVGPVPPPFGGVASVLEDIVHSELTRYYDFEIFERAPTVPAGGFLQRNLFRLKRILRFFKTVRKGHYRFVHIQASCPAFMQTTAFVMVARLAQAKVLLHLHGTDWDSFYPAVPWPQKLVTKAGISFSNRIVVLYEDWIKYIKSIKPSADVRVLMNRIHTEISAHPDLIESTRQSLDLTRDDFVVLTVGSVGYRKGHFEILKAVPQVVAENNSVRFVFVGGEEQPGELAQVQEMAHREKLNQWVRFTGERDRNDVPTFLEMADVFLLPSFFEGVPITIIEAMRSAVPVISTRVAGIPDLIENGVSGLLINPGSPHEIAEAVLSLSRDDVLRRKLAECGKASFDEKFEFSRGNAELKELYDSM
jgi:glycosyltransferase involved in cell wall biosynthesis